MLGLQRNIVFFRVNGASVAEKSWLACATVSGAVALAWKCSRAARAVELMVPGCSRYFFSSLMMLCYCVLHVLRHFVHWNCCIEEMCSFLELLEFEGSLARKRHCHSFDSWNSKEASHESFVFTNHGCDLNVRIWTKPCGFRVNGGSVAEKSWLACATGAGVVALAWKCSRTARSGTDGSR